MADTTPPPLDILWVTPFSRHSAIGKFSKLVTDALAARGVRVTIGSCEPRPIDPADAHPTKLPLILDADEVMAGLDRPDLIIYNVGNNYGFHGALPAMIARRSGLFVIHDFYLYDLFHEWLSAEKRMQEHDRHLTDIYGPTLAIAPPRQLDPNEMFQYRVENYPMLEWIAPHALGSVTHGRFGIPILRRVTAGPVTQIPLAFTLPMEEHGDAPAAPADATDLVQVTTFGDVNLNKRVDSIIKAIGSSERLKEKVRYSVVGSISEPERHRLSAFAESLGVRIELAGRATTAAWMERLHQADIICCLRFPTTESASATAIESMLAGKPLLVTDVGFYRDLPDDLVFKVDHRREVEMIAEHLERLMADPVLRVETGARVAAWAHETFDPASYAARIHDYAHEVIRIAPAVEVARTIAGTAEMLGLAGDDPAISRWIDLAETMFSPPAVEAA